MYPIAITGAPRSHDSADLAFSALPDAPVVPVVPGGRRPRLALRARLASRLHALAWALEPRQSAPATPRRVAEAC